MPPASRVNPFWKLTAALSALFCVCVMAVLAAGISTSASPLRHLLLRHGAMVVAIEAGLVMTAGVCAMGTDRRHAKRLQLPVVDHPADSEFREEKK